MEVMGTGTWILVSRELVPGLRLYSFKIICSYNKILHLSVPLCVPLLDNHISCLHLSNMQRILGHACCVLDLYTQGDGIALCRCIVVFLIVWQRVNVDWCKMLFVWSAVKKHSLECKKKWLNWCVTYAKIIVHFLYDPDLS